MPGYSDIAKQYLETNPYAPEPIAPVTQASNSREARSEELGAVNARMQNQESIGQSFIREGEAKAQGAAQSAGTLQQSKADASEIHQRAMQRLEGNQALQDQYRKMAERDLAGVKERGMANWGPLLTGIVGAMAGAGGNQGMAQGMSMLGSVIERSAQAKAQNAATTFQGHQELARTAMADSTNAVDAATKLMAQEHELAARDLERIAQETSIPVYREGALRLAEGTREQALNLLQGYKAAEAGRQEALELRKAKAGQKISMVELEALAQSGRATPEQMKKLLDLRKTAADIDKTNRPEKPTGEQPTPQGAEVLAGYHVAKPEIWDGLEKSVKAKFQQGQSIIPSTVEKMDELQKLIETHGTETWPTKAKADMQALKASLLGDLKEAEELGALDNGVSRLVDEQIGDPTAWNFGLGNWAENADSRIAKTRELVANKAKRKANAYGLVTAELGPPKPTQGGSEARANAPALKTLRLKGQ